jgi:hypothetical protein
MKQLVFEFLRNEPRVLLVPLSESTQEQLVELMAEAISAVHSQRVEGSDDGSSPAEQDHAGAS